MRIREVKLAARSSELTLRANVVWAPTCASFGSSARENPIDRSCPSMRSASAEFICDGVEHSTMSDRV